MTTDFLHDYCPDPGWIWIFSRNLPKFEQSLQESVDHFGKKFGHPPNIGFCHPNQFSDDTCDFSGLLVLKSRYILPNTILLGVLDDSVLQSLKTTQEQKREDLPISSLHVSGREVSGEDLLPT